MNNTFESLFNTILAKYGLTQRQFNDLAKQYFGGSSTQGHPNNPSTDKN
jgi:hypothetical protein